MQLTRTNSKKLESDGQKLTVRSRSVDSLYRLLSPTSLLEVSLFVPSDSARILLLKCGFELDQPCPGLYSHSALPYVVPRSLVA